MSKNYLVTFSGATGIPGLAPTFIIFKTVPGGVDVSSPPGITQLPTNTGLYYFTYGPTAPIAFTIDGATTSLVNRYVTDIIDPIQAVDEPAATLIAMGTTLIAMGTTLTMGMTTLVSFLGSTASSFGTTATDPTTVYGYLKRTQEFLEGNSVFTKNSGVWDIYSRGSGTTTQLRQKTLTDTSTTTTKS